MINFKTLAKVLLAAMFICAYSGESWAQENNTNTQCGCYNLENNDCKQTGLGSGCCSGANSIEGCREKLKQKGNDAAQGAAQGGNGQVPADFCGSDLGLFSSLVQTGQQIFQRLRDLIYVVAGFGIIAVAVGGFFGNLNWKWLGAIVISLVVIATAGELIVLITGCEQFGSSLITNTLSQPTMNYRTAQYNAQYTETAEEQGVIQWNDKFDGSDIYSAKTNGTYEGQFDDEFLEGYDTTSGSMSVTFNKKGEGNTAVAETHTTDKENGTHTTTTETTEIK